MITAPIWEYYHRASANVNGTNKVDGDTQYLVRSISKLVTALLALRTEVDLDTQVTQCLPQLSNKSSIISWGNTTLASLMDHLSGIPPNYWFSQFISLALLLEELGFPPLSPNDYSDFDIADLNGPCSQEREYLLNMFAALREADKSL